MAFAQVSDLRTSPFLKDVHDEALLELEPMVYDVNHISSNNEN